MISRVGAGFPRKWHPPDEPDPTVSGDEIGVRFVPLHRKENKKCKRKPDELDATELIAFIRQTLNIADPPEGPLAAPFIPRKQYEYWSSISLPAGRPQAATYLHHERLKTLEAFKKGGAETLQGPETLERLARQLELLAAAGDRWSVYVYSLPVGPWRLECQHVALRPPSEDKRPACLACENEAKLRAVVAKLRQCAAAMGPKEDDV